MFQVLIVCGYDTESTALVETLEQSLGNGCTDERLGSATELIDENE